MILSRKKEPPDPVVLLEDTTVEHVKEHKLLGVTITENLSWSPHILQVCIKAKRMLGCLYRTFHLADTNCLNYIYKAVITNFGLLFECVGSIPQGPPAAAGESAVIRCKSG